MPRENLKTFEAPTTGRITHTTDEVSGLCPFDYDGVRDYYTVDISYVPDSKCVELKSLKQYFESFQDREISHEDVTETIFRDLYTTLSPDEMSVCVSPNIRGGIKTEVTRSATTRDRLSKFFQSHRTELRHAVTLPQIYDDGVEVNVIRRGGNIVAGARYRICKQKNQTTLYDIAVDERHRRSGLASNLIDKIIEEEPHGKIVAKCPSDLPACEFYRSTGWAASGREDTADGQVTVFEYVV
jgi:7-cyano-7-deazaguanine reductase